MTNNQKQRLHAPVVIHLSGDVQKTLHACGIKESQAIQPVHEFIIAAPRRVLDLMQRYRGMPVLFVTKDLRYQRFRTIWKIYAAVGGMWRCMFADENGLTDRFSWWKLLIVDLPLLGVEIGVSCGVLIGGWFRLRRYRGSCQL